ncbi:MAG: tetratricopeptide repeat protein [Bacteroidota bacterium]
MMTKLISFVLLLLTFMSVQAQSVSRAELPQDVKKSLKYHERSLRLDPYHGPTYRARGVLYYEIGEYESALKDLNKALAYKDSSYLTLYNKGLTLLKLNRAAEARKSFELAVRKNPNHPQTLGYVGYYQLQSGKTEAAVETFSRAIAIDSTLTMIRLNRATAYYQMGQLEASIADMRLVLAAEPFHPVCLSNLGLALCEAKQCEEGIQYLDQALSVAPNMAEAWYNRGLARYTRGELQDAMADFRQAKSLNPNLVIRLNGEVWEP